MTANSFISSQYLMLKAHILLTWWWYGKESVTRPKLLLIKLECAKLKYEKLGGLIFANFFLMSAFFVN